MKSQLKLDVVEARDITFTPKERAKRIGSYCTVLFGDKVYKTKLSFPSPNNNSLSWNECFSFDVEGLGDNLGTIVLERWSKEGRFHGAITVDASSLEANALHDISYPFLPKENTPPPKDPSKLRISGQLRLYFYLQTGEGPKQQQKRFVDVVEEKVLESLSPIERQRQEVIYELIATEVSYVKDLISIQEMFLDPLRTREILSKEEIGKLFLNLKDLVPVNRDFSKDLLQRQTDNVVIQEIGDLFLKYADLFKYYAVYCSNQPVIPSLIEEFKSMPYFASFLEETPTLATLRGLTFESFLIKPLQRICKYPLLLRELLKYTPEEHVDYKNLVEADQKIKTVVDMVNERTRTVESVMRVIFLEKQLHFPKQGKSFTLATNSRRFIRDGKGKLKIKKKQTEVAVFLFNDLLLATKPLKKSHHFKKATTLSSSSVLRDHPSDPECTFELEDNEDLFVLTLSTKEDKKIWMTAIEKALQPLKLSVSSASASTSSTSLQPPVSTSSKPSSPSPSPSPSPNPPSLLDTAKEIDPELDKDGNEVSEEQEQESPPQEEEEFDDEEIQTSFVNNENDEKKGLGLGPLPFMSSPSLLSLALPKKKEPEKENPIDNLALNLPPLKRVDSLSLVEPSNPDSSSQKTIQRALFEERQLREVVEKENEKLRAHVEELEKERDVLKKQVKELQFRTSLLQGVVAFSAPTGSSTTSSFSSSSSSSSSFGGSGPGGGPAPGVSPRRRPASTLLSMTSDATLPTSGTNLTGSSHVSNNTHSPAKREKRPTMTAFMPHFVRSGSSNKGSLSDLKEKEKKKEKEKTKKKKKDAIEEEEESTNTNDDHRSRSLTQSERTTPTPSPNPSNPVSPRKSSAV